MAEGGYDEEEEEQVAYQYNHVPQQSRRDKLRVVLIESRHPDPAAASTTTCCRRRFDLQPDDEDEPSPPPPPTASHHLCSPSFLPSDLLSTCSLSSLPLKSHTSSSLGGGGGYAGGHGFMTNHHIPNNINASTSHHPTRHLELDPQGHLNPNTQILDINTAGSDFLFATNSSNPQNFNMREFSGGGEEEVVAYKPEALSVTHHQDQSNHNQSALSLSLSSLYYNRYHHQNLPLEQLSGFHSIYGPPIINDRIIPGPTSVSPAADGGGGYLVPPAAASGGINLCRSGNGGGGDAASSYDLSASLVPLGSFTGYASILKGSRFLKPTQQLLEDYCSVGQRINTEPPSSSSLDSSPDSLGRTDIVDDEIEYSSLGPADGKKSRLISMLNEVYRKYRQYYHQMQAAVSSFESISGLGNATPYAHLALKTMNKHFRCLKNAITDQLQFASKVHGKDVPKFGSTDGGCHRQRSIHSPGFSDNQAAWRPQRGLPERAVTVLRAWLFEHFLHPYPTDTDKMMLAKQTGLSRNQVSNWFINARVRLWKPMVEEIHSLETRQGQRSTSEWEEPNTDGSTDHLPSSGTSATAHPSSSTQRNQDVPFKRTRNEFDAASRADESSINLSSYGHFTSHLHRGGGGASTPLQSSNVSLSLGLYQNNGIVLSEAFPINAAHRFGIGLDLPSDGYAMNSFDAEGHHFG